MAAMLMTILKIVAGIAALGVVSLVLVAVVSGLRSSANALQNPEENNDHQGGD
jgi:hypothetical protein